jgi:phosphoglycolate phosphatase-like HAD superfamily hydrolase
MTHGEVLEDSWFFVNICSHDKISSVWLLILAPGVKMPGMKHVIFDCDGTLVDTRGPKFKLFPGIRELLEDISTDYSLWVWTARGRKSTLRILSELEIIGYFEEFSTPDTAPPKPHPGGLDFIMDRVRKEDIVVIGDTSNDISGARGYGVRSIGALWNGEASADVLREAGAEFVVSHPAECSTLIRRNLKGE